MGYFGFGVSFPNFGHWSSVGWGGDDFGFGNFYSQTYYSLSGFDGFSSNFGGYSGPAGFYYGWSVGNGGFVRISGNWGPWGWSPYGGGVLGRGALAVANMAGDWDFNPFDPRQVRDYLENRFPRTGAGDGADKKEGEDKKAPDSAGERAKDYFDGIVRDKKRPGEVYEGDVRKAIADKEKEEAKTDSNVEGREKALVGLAERIASWMNGDNSAVKRAEFLAQMQEWQSNGSGLDTDKRLLALIAPGVESPEDIPQATAQRLLAELGDNRQPSEPTPANIFSAYVQMLKDRLGGEYESVVTNYFERASALAASRTNQDIPPVTADDIKKKGYTDEEANTIMKKAFANITPLKARRLFEKLPDVTGKSEQEKASYLAGWYLEHVRGVKEKEKRDEIYRKAVIVKGRWNYNIVRLIGELERLTSKEKSGAPPAADTRSTGGAGGAGSAGGTGGAGGAGSAGGAQKVKALKAEVAKLNDEFRGKVVFSYNAQTQTLNARILVKDMDQQKVTAILHRIDTQYQDIKHITITPFTQQST